MNDKNILFTISEVFRPVTDSQVLQHFFDFARMILFANKQRVGRIHNNHVFQPDCCNQLLFSLNNRVFRVHRDRVATYDVTQIICLFDSPDRQP